MDKKQYYFLSGLPRSGSTLLSSLLSQNDKIYAGGNSPVCQLMWDTQVSVHTNSYQQIMANNKLDIAYNLIRNILDVYYKDVKETILKRDVKNYLSNDILEKCYDLNKSLDIIIRNKAFTNS